MSILSVLIPLSANIFYVRMWNFFRPIIVFIYITTFTRSLDRGFTQSFQTLEIEKNKDRTKKFEASRIVEVFRHFIFCPFFHRNNI
jgi:hypothetical protein